LAFRHLRAARQAFEEDSDARKEYNALQSLLKEAVKKQTRFENGREGKRLLLPLFKISNEMFAGLIIQEATYGAAETDKDDPYVTLNVTAQLQALVRNSQLHITGGDSRVLFELFSLYQFSYILYRQLCRVFQTLLHSYRNRSAFVTYSEIVIITRRSLIIYRLSCHWLVR
jgi:hypothetical protein